MNRTLIKNAFVVNEHRTEKTDVLIEGERIARVGSIAAEPGMNCIDAEGLYLLPGVIDGQVHFRDPGLTHKADLNSESRAAVAGGVTSFIDMPNTRPNVLNMEILEAKYALAATKSMANFGFFLGVNGENVDEVLATDTSGLLAVSDDGLYFSGKGNLLADNLDVLEKLLANCPSIIAIHAEKEAIVEKNEEAFRAKYGDYIPASAHPLIRSAENCYLASRDAIELAKKHNARLHILHLTTARETELFEQGPVTNKRITTEVSVHHLWFSDADYERLGMRIKWNPAIKTAADRDGLLQALIDDRIDLVTTDHAPHTTDEKDNSYFHSMSGAPMVQHTLHCMLEFYLDGKITLEKIVEKMCHNPALLYRMTDRGFIREGGYADLVLVNMQKGFTVSKENILYKCGWSPLEGTAFRTSVEKTFVNGQLAYNHGVFDEDVRGKALEVTPQAVA